MNNEPVSRATYLSLSRDLDAMTNARDALKQEADRLRAALQLLKAELKERGERILHLETQVETFSKFYEWYSDAGSWSHVSLNPSEGSRWILKHEEMVQGGQLQLKVDAALAPKKKCPSTYSHTTLGKLFCRKEETHLHRRGDVEHESRGIKWMSI